MTTQTPAENGNAKTTSRTRSDRMQDRLDTTRQAIMAAALELFDAEPYRDVSIRRIMTKAGFSVGTFYNFFQDKEDLIAQAARELMTSAGTFLQEIPSDASSRRRLEAMMEGAARFIAANSSLVNLFMEAVASQPEIAESHGSTHAVASVAFTRKLIEEGQAAGDLRKEIDAQVAAELLQNCLGAPRKAPADEAGRAAFVQGVLSKASIVLDALETR